MKSNNNVSNKIKNKIAPYTLAGSMTLGALALSANADAQTQKNNLINPIISNDSVAVHQAQQEFNGKQKAYKLAKVYDWYTNAVNNKANIDSLEYYLLANDNTYDATNATVMTNPRNGFGALNVINGKLYVALDMVGKSGGKFKNEKTQKRDYTTTFPSAANYMNLTDEELKESLSMYNKWDAKDIKIVRDNLGKVVNIDYLGNGDKRTLTTRELLDGEKINHARWMPGNEVKTPDGSKTEFYNVAHFPADKFLTALGYNLPLARELKAKGLSDSDYLRLLNDQIKKLANAQDSLDAVNKNLLNKNDSLKTDVSNLANALKKWNVGVSGGVTSYWAPQAGLNVEFGKLGLGMSYTSENTKHLGNEFTENRTNPPAGRPSNVGTLVRQATKDSYFERHAIEGIISYKIGENLRLLLTGGLSESNNYNVTVDHFWRELKGPDGKVYKTEEKLEAPFVIDDKKTSPLVGAGAEAKINDRFRLYIRGSVPVNDVKNSYGSAGASIYLRNHNKKNNKK